MIRAVLLDALGTLVELEPPWEHLPAGPRGDLPAERVRAAFRAEMAYYRDHSHEGRDPASLLELRARCAAVLSEGLGRGVTVEEMMAAIRFRAYPDAPPALEELAARGLRLVVVSNWDCSLQEVLARVGLAEHLDGVVSSAEAGARKPAPEIFARALELAGVGPPEAVHVGDTPEEDRAGALAAGIRPLIIDRRGDGGDIASLGELTATLGR
jgi:putative hydrolase of the HAD superfamily